MVITRSAALKDIESLPFLEAIRQFKTDIGREHVLYIHVTLVPYLKTAGIENKADTAQCQELRSIGISLILLSAAVKRHCQELKDKIALFCDIDKNAVIENPDVEFIYQLPLMLENSTAEIVCEHLGLLSSSQTC